MRYKVFILSLCVLLYLVEFAATPRMMVTPGQTDCCRGMKKERGKCPHSSKDCHSATETCVNCPLCYVLLLPDPVQPAFAMSAKPVYFAFASTYQYDFYRLSWKPPNQA